MQAEIDSKYGKVFNINYNKVKVNKNQLNVAKKVVALSMSAVMFFAGLGIGKANEKTIDKTSTVNLNPNQIIATVQNSIDPGETLSEIASKYYNEDYEKVYGSEVNFINSIKKQNNIENDDLIVSGQKLTIPVIIDKNNSYFQNIMMLTAKINELEENEKWIKYTVRLDDNLSMLAGWGSGNHVSVSVEEENEIARHNNLQTKTIYPGQELEIINPKIGNLKIELRKAEQEFKESLINNQKTK